MSCSVEIFFIDVCPLCMLEEFRTVFLTEIVVSFLCLLLRVPNKDTQNNLVNTCTPDKGKKGIAEQVAQLLCVFLWRKKSKIDTMVYLPCFSVFLCQLS